MAAQVTELEHLATELKWRLTAVLRAGQGQAPLLGVERAEILKEHVGRSIASVQATLKEAETLSNKPLAHRSARAPATAH